MLYDLRHDAPINTLAWLSRVGHVMSLASGSSHGIVTIWSLEPNHRFCMKSRVTYPAEIETLVFDPPSQHLLVGMNQRVSVLKLPSPSKTVEESFDCKKSIGGISFLDAGSRAAISLSSAKKM
jgi:hypothetical protein